MSHNRVSQYTLCRRTAAIGAALVVVVSAAILIVGWMLDVEVVRSPFGDGNLMKANTALAFALAGTALLLEIRPDVSPFRRRLAITLAVLLTVLGAVTIYQYLSGTDLGIDQLLAPDPGSTGPPGRIAPNSAIAFMLVGLALVTIDRARWVSVALTSLTTVIGCVALVGHFLGIEGLYGLGGLRSMTAASAAMFLVVGISSFLARPEVDPVVRLTWDDGGGQIARRLLPVVTVVFVGVIWLVSVVAGEKDGVIRPETLLLAIVVQTILLIGVIWLLAREVHEKDVERGRATAQLIDQKDRFMASVSHELRTPVTAVVAFAELLNEMDERISDSERQDMLKTMAREGADLVALLEDLLVAARSGSGSLSVASVRVSLRAQVAQAVEALSTEEPHVEEVVGPEVLVRGDPLRVRQILRNLLTNAERYGGGRVRVEIEEGDGVGRVRVSDNGQGMTADQAGRAFEPYATLHGQEGRPGSVGLGLPVARDLALRMGGGLEYSRDGDWTVFELTLPLLEMELDGATSVVVGLAAG